MLACVRDEHEIQSGHNRFLGRFGQPEDIARVAVFLASEDPGWVTGERVTVTVAGGYR